MKIHTLPIVMLLMFITSGCTSFHIGTIKVADAEGNAIPKIPVTITRSENLFVNISGSYPSGSKIVGHTNEYGILQFFYLPKEQHCWFLRLFGKKEMPRQTLTIDYEMPNGYKVNTTLSIEPR